jgi:hypothetical protein
MRSTRPTRCSKRTGVQGLSRVTTLTGRVGREQQRRLSSVELSDDGGSLARCKAAVQCQWIERVKLRGKVLQSVAIFRKNDHWFVDPAEEPLQRADLALAGGRGSRQCCHVLQPTLFFTRIAQPRGAKLESWFLVRICRGIREHQLLCRLVSRGEKKRDTALNRTRE